MLWVQSRGGRIQIAMNGQFVVYKHLVRMYFDETKRLAGSIDDENSLPVIRTVLNSRDIHSPNEGDCGIPCADQVPFRWV
jgi:glutamine phosphoribosylpyrophosphate amidotransferase